MDFFPKSAQFFDLLADLAALARDSGEIVKATSSAKKNGQQFARRSLILEERADRLYHQIRREADQTFITPIDREDIQQLAHTLDTIVDLTEDFASRLHLYKISKLPKEMATMQQLIFEATKEVYKAVDLLRNRTNGQSLQQAIIAIHRLENKGDHELRLALQAIFATSKNSILIMKWKDLLETTEKILNECERTADTVEQIISKNF